MIHVDIQVVLEKANVVFNMDHLAFKEMPWWQKVLIGSAAAVAFSATVKAMEYFVQEIEEPLHKKSDKLLPEDKPKR